MRYETRIADGVVEVSSPRTGTVHVYQIPAGSKPTTFALRCAERARVTECLSAIRDPGHRRAWATHVRRPRA